MVWGKNTAGKPPQNTLDRPGSSAPVTGHSEIRLDESPPRRAQSGEETNERRTQLIRREQPELRREAQATGAEVLTH